MTDVTPVPIGSERVTTGDEIVVVSPYDGHEVGRVPSCGAAEVDRAVAAAHARLVAGRGDEPFLAAERAAVLDRAATLLDERAEQFARVIADEAAKPIRTALVEARRAVDTFRFSAVEARSLTGDVVPLDAKNGDTYWRCDPGEPAETDDGGNGVSGHDETSEDLTAAWRLSKSSATPGMAPVDAGPCPTR